MTLSSFLYSLLLCTRRRHHNYVRLNYVDAVWRGLNILINFITMESNFSKSSVNSLIGRIFCHQRNHDHGSTKISDNLNSDICSTLGCTGCAINWTSPISLAFISKFITIRLLFRLFDDDAFATYATSVHRWFRILWLSIAVNDICTYITHNLYWLSVFDYGMWIVNFELSSRRLWMAIDCRCAKKVIYIMFGWFFYIFYIWTLHSFLFFFLSTGNVLIFYLYLMPIIWIEGLNDFCMIVPSVTGRDFQLTSLRLNSLKWWQWRIIPWAFDIYYGINCKVNNMKKQTEFDQ